MPSTANWTISSSRRPRGCEAVVITLPHSTIDVLRFIETLRHHPIGVAHGFAGLLEFVLPRGVVPQFAGRDVERDIDIVTRLVASLYHRLHNEVERLAGYASVVAAQYNESEDALQKALTDEGVAWKAIGDCLAPRTALEAVYEGHEIGLAL